MRIIRYISIFLLCTLALFYIRTEFSPFQTYNGRIFGTTYHIKIRTKHKNNLLENKIKTVLQEVNAHMSMFDSNSEISRINQTAAGKKISLSPDLSYLMAKAAQVYRESQGAFDPTVAPLINLWGFGVNAITKLPTSEQIREVLKYTGFAKLRFNGDFSQLTKTDSRTGLDLSAIAKGYGVDKVAQVLEQNGYHDYIVEIGGEIRASGSKDSSGTPWSIGIARPGASTNQNALTMDLTNYAVATSGDYRNFFYQNGRRYAHTVSPQNGYPVEHNLASATVFHQDCILADAYATAVMAMGEIKGLEMAERIDLPLIIFIRGSDDKISMQTSSAAKRLIGE